ncbi:hypothetical protein BGX33_005620 [Mortierella sp. NVP41]|nr:hypothetical protein BGX33_005620 [Mortierella sp. NVP41]
MTSPLSFLLPPTSSSTRAPATPAALSRSVSPVSVPWGTLNCLASKTATVFILSHITTGSTYSRHDDTVPLQSYSARFTIKGVDHFTTIMATSATHAVTTATTTSGVFAATTTTVEPTSTDMPVSNKNEENSASSVKKSFTVGVAVVAAAVRSFFI